MNTGDLIDSRYKVEGTCSTSGGMGNIVFVHDLKASSRRRLVLKYCKSFDPKLRRRFSREIHLLQSFQGNSRVAEIIAFNPDHEPPYFVMPFYENGDLSPLHRTLKDKPELQEGYLLMMIDCVSELHGRGVFHRDIKPQNFLNDLFELVVSDMGLSVDTFDTTTLTSTAEFAGTFSYMPPEAREEGFKEADAAYDIFMLGKTFYNILTGRDPLYMTPLGIPPGLFHLIQRAADPNKTRRFQSLPELKQAVIAVYDIILRRVHGLNNCKSKLETVTSRLARSNEYVTNEVNDVIDSILTLDADDQDAICQALDSSFFGVVAQEPFDTKRGLLLLQR